MVVTYYARTGHENGSDLYDRSMDLQLEHKLISDAVALIKVVGELDVYTSAKFRDLTIKLIDSGHTRIVLDLTYLEYLDSTGNGVIVGTLKRCRKQGGSVSLVINQERIAKIFRITGLSKVFAIFEDVDSAVAWVMTDTGPAPGKADKKV